MGMEVVLVAKSEYSSMKDSASRVTFCLTIGFSNTASMTRSQSSKSCGSSVVLILRSRGVFSLLGHERSLSQGPERRTWICLGADCGFSGVFEKGLIAENWRFLHGGKVFRFTKVVSPVENYIAAVLFDAHGLEFTFWEWGSGINPL